MHHGTSNMTVVHTEGEG